MKQYDAYLICLNGHPINEFYHRTPHLNKNFCAICGSETIKSCPKCGKDIVGNFLVPDIYDLSSTTPIPDACQHCGNDFPWRSKKTQIKENIKLTNKDDLFLIATLMDRFHLVVKQLRQRYNERETLDVNDEYDVQNLFHSLLTIYYDDIRPEEWNPSYAGTSTRSDFLLKKEKIVIEVKKTRSGLKAKQLGEQLIIDIAKYKTHPDCKVLYCFVYDPDGYIANPRGIESDLNVEKEGEMKVIVKIVPKGH